MSDSDFPVEAETAFLIEVQRVFTTTFSNETIANAYAYSLNKDFKDILKAKMEYYNTNKENADLIGKLKSNLHSMKDDLIDVADVLSQRGDKVNLIVKRAMALKEESMSYYQNV